MEDNRYEYAVNGGFEGKQKENECEYVCQDQIDERVASEGCKKKTVKI